MIFKPYLSIEQKVEAVYVVKRSKFICRLYPVQSDEDAFEYIAVQSKEFKDATHNCYAFLTGNTERFSDDNEPQGTAGLPMLTLLKQKGLSGVLAVSTRYFGGIKLGSGGLKDAYRTSVEQALDSANIIQVEYCTCAILTIDYQGLAALQNNGSPYWWITAKPNYGESVTVSVAFRVADKEKALGSLNDLTLGKVKIDIIEDKYETVR